MFFRIFLPPSVGPLLLRIILDRTKQRDINLLKLFVRLLLGSRIIDCYIGMNKNHPPTITRCENKDKLTFTGGSVQRKIVKNILRSS